MARYLAAAGIRKIQAAGAKLDEYPFIIIIGPSGQAGQIHGPSGVAAKVPANGIALQGYGQTYNHKCIAYGRKEILYSLRNSETSIGTNLCYAFMMYAKNEPTKTNDSSFNPENNVNFANLVIRDGFSHKMICGRINDVGFAYWSFIKIPGAIHWTFPRNTNNPTQGYFVWQNEKFVLGGSISGWRPLPGALGLLSDSDPSFQVGHAGNTGTPDVVNGIDTARSIVGINVNVNVCDMIYHKGIIYEAYQYRIVARMPGTRGSYIFHDYIDDTDFENSTYTSTYASRAENAQYTPVSRSLTIHGDDVYMLDNKGKVFIVRPGGIRQISDVSLLPTPWSSGIIGGPAQTSAGTFAGHPFRRCFITSFNNQLNAFLNYSTGYKVAKGTEGSNITGKGIFWATSHDGVSWTDRTEMLPGSGIIPTSGSLFGWLSDIEPYRFSGRIGYNRNLISPFQAQASGFGKGVKASGLRQHKFIPWIHTSGTMIDQEGTAFNLLQCPLNRGAVSGFLGPTFIQKPAGFNSISGVFQPFGVGASGWDFTGCHNWHISGFADENDKKLKLLFSEDYHGTGTYGSSLFYELDTSSGWNRKNYLAKSNQLNGLIPIDLFDPEIVIPSGDLYNPNPRIDEVNQIVSLDYRIHSWPFWDEVGTKLEYTLDGKTWNHAAGHRNLSTGTKISDPSGTIGSAYTFHWKYTDQLSKNEFFPYLQLRVRATKEE